MCPCAYYTYRYAFVYVHTQHSVHIDTSSCDVLVCWCIYSVHVYMLMNIHLVILYMCHVALDYVLLHIHVCA